MFKKKKDRNKDEAKKESSKKQDKLPLAEQKVLLRQQKEKERLERKVPLDSKIKAEKLKNSDKSVLPSRTPSVDPNYPDKNKSGESQLTVALRIRPLHPAEEQKGFFEVARKVDNKMVVLMDPQTNNTKDVLRAKRSNEKQFVFDCTFDGTATQEEVYAKTTKKLIDNVLNGYNGTVFAYGATGAGKTHTMVGADHDPGTMVRALNDLFSYMENTKDEKKYQVTMSYMEIYNEMIRDLLCPSTGYLELRENAKGAHKVAGLSELPIKNPNEVMNLLMKGNKQRTQEPTAANKTSSRSHALLQVIIKMEDRLRDINTEVKTGHLFMVDLAGSERAAQTQNSGKRLIEGAHINRSLLALGNCINALASAKGAKYVNFRDSKLTRLLKEPLSGNCRTVMIAHVSPASHHFDESRNTLLYADRAKNIKNKITSNVNNVDFHVTQYKQIITELRQEIQRLQTKLEKEPTTDVGNDKPPLPPDHMSKLKSKFSLSFKHQMALRQQMMELDNTMLALSTEFDKLTIIIEQLEVEKAQKKPSSSNSKDGKEKKKKKKSKDKKNKNIRQEVDEDEDIKAAWEEIRFIQSEQSKYLQIREDVQLQFESCHDEIYRLEEELPSLISNSEQREIIELLCKCHVLEIQKMEIQTETLIRQYELKKKELMIHRYDRQRELSEEIITKQRALIDVLADSDSLKHAEKKNELLTLYNKYQQELEEMNTDRDTPTNGNKIRASSVMSIKQGARSQSISDLTGGKLFNRRESLDKLPILPLDDRSNNRMRSDSIISVRTQLGGSLPTTPLTNSDHANKLPPIGNAVNGISTPPNKNDVTGNVRNISALAARKRSNEYEDVLKLDKSEKSRKNKKASSSAKPSKERRNSGASVFDTFSIIAEDERQKTKKSDGLRKGLKTAGMRRSNSTTTLKKYRPTSTTSRDIDQMLSFSLMH